MNSVVLKGKLGAGFNDDRYTLPKDGNAGDILVRTETGSAWQKQEPATTTPDWDQNDPTASDFIKNRPFYKTVETIWGEQKSITTNNTYISANTALNGKVRGTYDGTPFEFEMEDQGEFGYWGKKEFDAGTSDIYFMQNIIFEDPGAIYIRDANSHEVVYQFGETGTEYTKIDANYIPETSIASGSITGEMLATQTISGLKIKNRTITDANLVLGTITASAIADEAITTTKIADGTITYYKLNDSLKLLLAPRVDQSDNGKILRVSGGNWAAEEWTINSSTAGSTKKFKITVDDSGTLSATEVT